MRDRKASQVGNLFHNPSVAEAGIVERNSFRWHVRNRSTRTMIANLTQGQMQELRLVRRFMRVFHRRNEFRSTILPNHQDKMRKVRMTATVIHSPLTSHV